MIYIPEDLANQIGALALDFTSESHFKECYSSNLGGTTIWREFEYRDLLCGIQFTQLKSQEKQPSGFHLNIMSNGDVFARDFPYYDGTLELIAVYNQRKIFELISQHI